MFTEVKKRVTKKSQGKYDGNVALKNVNKEIEIFFKKWKFWHRKV